VLDTILFGRRSERGWGRIKAPVRQAPKEIRREEQMFHTSPLEYPYGNQTQPHIEAAESHSDSGQIKKQERVL